LFGALHRNTFRRQLAEDQREEGQRQGDEHDRRRSCRAAEEAERWFEWPGKRHGR
jgi:hypothetical protein